MVPLPADALELMVVDDPEHIGLAANVTPVEVGTALTVKETSLVHTPTVARTVMVPVEVGVKVTEDPVVELKFPEPAVTDQLIVGLLCVPPRVAEHAFVCPEQMAVVVVLFVTVVFCLTCNTALVPGHVLPQLYLSICRLTAPEYVAVQSTHDSFVVPQA